ncbi:DUF362 domain-containing protein [Halosolutus gelatinilyticus]|uniref:DUF362 domain-containing protein n=1 Tax=Halosolutus gelatinilyticus TaxID=2931975 RepID=UPI001FF302BC|nr:DUF362 domain-containing protein [Halosolutus gelatinilyticus]
MSSVRGTAIATGSHREGWTPSVETRMAALETPIRRLLEPRIESLAAADGIAIVPDAHYPFHPSSGVVTDPAVVGALVATLERETGAAVAVVGTSGVLSFDRTAEFLGYPDVLDRFGAELVDVDDAASRVTETRTVADRSVALAVPERLLEDAVVPVPSLRPTRDGPVAGGMRTLARLVDRSTDAGIAAAAATAAVDPVCSVLDATIAYAGEPYAADALLAGPIPAVDAIGARLLDRSLDEDEALRYAKSPEPDAVDVDGVDTASLRERLPSGELPTTTNPHPAVSLAYRTYAAISGDVVPPQLDGGPRL